MGLTRESRDGQFALANYTAISRCVFAATALLVLAFQSIPGAAVAAPFAYVTNAGAGTVSVVDTATDVVIPSGIPVGSLPEQVAAKPDGTLVYVTNAGSGTVSVIATATNTVLGSPIPVGSAPSGLAVTPDGSRVYVANSGSDTVSVIATATNTVLGSPIPVGVAPTGVAIARSNIGSIPILSDLASWLLVAAMSAVLTLRIIARSVRSRQRTSGLV